MRYFIYDSTNKIKRRISCPPQYLDSQLHAGEKATASPKDANDVTHKIVDDKAVKKTAVELEADALEQKVAPFEKQQANITNEQLQEIKNRLGALEK